MTLALCAMVAFVPACSREREPAPTVRTAEYEVRGRITDLPREGSPASDLRVYHESMPSFRHTWPADDGVTPKMGMGSMDMNFPPAEGLSLEGVAIGDAVVLTFEVDYRIEDGTIASYRTTSIERLPDGVTLDLPDGD
jgi:hypothetical protein